MHWVFDREYSEELPDPAYLEKYRRLLLQLPDDDVDILAKHLENARLEFYCKCGCHSFLVYPADSSNLPVRSSNGLFREIAYRTNYGEALNVMLLPDINGILSQVTVFLGIGNTMAIPGDLDITGIEGIWKSGSGSS